MPGKGLSVYQRIRQSGLAKAHIIIADSARRLLGKKLSDEIIVYRLDPTAYSAGPPAPTPAGFEVRRYDRFEDVPQAHLSTLHPLELARIREDAKRETASGAVFWIGYIDGVFAASQFSIRGQFLKQWYLPLATNDIVIYGADTLNAFRGRGIHSAIIRAAIDREVDADAYCDTTVWNVVAQRNIEKAGFRPVTHARSMK